MRVVVVDAGYGNLRSVERALEAAGARASLSGLTVERVSHPEGVRGADRVVVPGQGHFGDMARALRGGVADVLHESIAAGTPYLGICLGLQILFAESDEAPGQPGLGVFPGRVRRLEQAEGIKIPHMGWNQLELSEPAHPVLSAAGGHGAWMYFVHSFHAVPDDPTLVVARAGYGPNTVTAAVARDNVLATQFHPEKSQRAGLALLAAFLGG